MNKQQYLIERGIGKIYLNKTFYDYEGKSKKVLKWIKEYAENPQKKGGLMTGINGIGKTMLMNILFIRLFEKGNSIAILPYWELIKEYIAWWKNEGKLERYLKVKFLGINDLGKGYENSENSKQMAKAVLEYVLDYRIQNELPTFFTTNLKVGEIRGFYGDDIASKLNEACTILQFAENDKVNDDYRIKKAEIIKG